jgi:lambda family phage portal protein
VLWRYRWRQPQDGLPVPLQIQLLEIDYLDTWRQGGAASGNVVVNGIEYDPIGRRVAYWLYDQHPGDVTMRPGSRIISKRVDAGLVGHYYDAARPGQGRGISRLAPVISTARDLQLLLDAEINRKNMEARLGVIASGDMAGAINVPTGSSVDAMSQLRQLGDLPSGGIVQLPPGLSINTIAPNAAPGFPENVKLYLHLISAGVGVPYELMTGDMSEVNFSSARVRRLDFKRANERQQWNNHIPNFLMPVSQAFCTGAVMVNKATRQARIGATEWTTPRIEYVNPAQEVEAAVMAIASGQASISSFIRGRGDDPKTVFAELESDFKALKGAGVLEMLMFMLKGKDFGSSGGGSQASAQGNKP